MPVILATREAEAGESQVRGQHGHRCETLPGADECRSTCLSVFSALRSLPGGGGGKLGAEVPRHHRAARLAGGVGAEGFAWFLFWFLSGPECGAPFGGRQPPWYFGCLWGCSPHGTLSPHEWWHLVPQEGTAGAAGCLSACLPAPCEPSPVYCVYLPSIIYSKLVFF